MITSNVTTYDFYNAFANVRPDQFTYDALKALYDYLDQLSDDIGEPLELDVIAICCDFCEYASLEEVLKEYSLDNYDELYGSTVVLELPNGGLVIQQF
tara:strand:+ start:171 stop:464 length:294 start_codon:yes stop_codon:yes gene_type:complete